MTYRFLFLLSISYFVVIPVFAQEEGCHPTFVSSLVVTDDLVLRWTSNPKENCTISYYLVYLQSRDVETLYTIEGMSMDVGFLPICDNVMFSVTPVSSDDIEGQNYILYTIMPVPRGENITIEYIRVEQQSGDNVLLSWELEEKWRPCTTRFRVLIYNEDYDDPEDIYVTSNSARLQDLHPCEAYTFGVRAIHNYDSLGPILSIRYLTPSRRMAAPALKSIILGTTSVDLDWQFENYTQNRCEVTSIVIDAPPYFSAAYPVRDNPERPIVSTNITDLEPDSIYFLNVTVINTAGPSVPLLTAVQTLPNS